MSRDGKSGSEETNILKTKEDVELELLRKMRLAFGTILHMLECARDDLKAMGDRMDRLRCASEQCRQALEQKDTIEHRDHSINADD